MTTLAYLRVSKDAQDTKTNAWPLWSLPGRSGWRWTRFSNSGFLAPLHHNRKVDLLLASWTLGTR